MEYRLSNTGRWLILILFISTIISLPQCLWGFNKSEVKHLRLFVNLWYEDRENQTLSIEEAKTINKFLRKDDLLFVHPKAHQKIIKEIKGSIVIFGGSYDKLIGDVEFAKSKGIKFSYLGYNLETFPTHRAPDDEKENPVFYFKKVRKLADENKVKIVNSLPLYKEITSEYLNELKELVTGADVIHLEVQRYQLLPVDEFGIKVKESVEIVKKANPKVLIFVQLSTNPPTHGKMKGDSYDLGHERKGGEGRKKLKSMSPEDILIRIEAIKDLVDGVGFLLFEQKDGFKRFMRVIEQIR